jgi:predicted permease
MNSLAVIVVCLALGLLLQRSKRLPESSAVTLNLYVIYIALPALVLAEIPRLHLELRALLPVLFAWVLMAFSALVTWLTARAFGWSRGVTGVLMLTVPLGNTGFVGIPIVEAFFGTAAVPYAILYDQFGTFIALNTFGMVIAAHYANAGTAWRQLAVSIVSFPPFIALCFAFAMLPFNYPDWLSGVLSRISTTLVPVVMVAVGLQWRLRLERKYFVPLAIGLVYMLLLTPALAYIGVLVLGVKGLVADVIVFQAAMPAMISAAILAMSHNLAPRLAASLVGYSLLLSLFTLWLWHLLLR